MEPPLAPVRTDERIVFLDVLRGFALLGIIVVNSLTFFSPLFDTVLTDGRWQRPVDDAARMFVTVLFQSKFYTLFAFLFGVGAAIQKRRCEARGQQFLTFFWRRMGVLLVFGLLHATLLWFGDILAMYAMCGFLLAILALIPRLFQRLLTGLLMLAPLGLVVLFAALMFLIQTVPEGAGELQTALDAQMDGFREMRDRALQAYAHGSWGEIFRIRLAELGAIYTATAVIFPAMLGVMLLGFQFGAAGFFDRLEQHRPRMLRWLPGLAIVGLLLNALGGWGAANADGTGADASSVLTMLMVVIGAPALSAVYGITLFEGFRGPRSRRLTAPLAAVGRMALTNYLLQTVLMTSLAYNWGAGLYGRVSPWAGVGIGVLVFALQIPLSGWWLGRYRMGPAEWLWRTLTYGRRPAMRRPAC